MEKGVNTMPAPKGHAPYNKNGEGGVKKIYTDEYLENEAVLFLDWMKKPDSLYFKKFAIERGYSPQRLNEFADSNEKFAEAFRFAKQWQEVRISEGAMRNELNASYSKFFMANVCDWHEKQETRLSGDNSNPLAFILKECLPDTKDLVNDSDEESDNQFE